jgi:hypothetical protein
MNKDLNNLVLLGLEYKNILLQIQEKENEKIKIEGEILSFLKNTTLDDANYLHRMFKTDKKTFSDILKEKMNKEIIRGYHNER